jgi:CRISPR-associated protein Cmr6
MALPLYQALYRKEHSISFGKDAHRGLWWSRFFDKFSADFGKPGDGEKGAFIQEICRGRCGDDDQLTASANRTLELIQALAGETCIFISQGRFATGMGNDHPTENGFTWHPMLGVPYLPASSVKGLVRGWIEWQAGQTAIYKDGGDAALRHKLLNWFGSENKDPHECVAEHQAGWFIFFDALPVKPVQLAADVMTPHYAKWYEKGGGDNPLVTDTIPADWHSPVPVTFLTVKQASFQFAIAVRGGLAEAQQQLAQTALPEVMAVLQDALEWAGAGAKTATGYGRMSVDEKAQKEAASQREQAQAARLENERKSALNKLSPNIRAIEELRVEIEKRLSRGKIPISDAFWNENIKKLALQAAESSEWNSEEKVALATMLEEWAGKLMKLDAKDLRKQLKLAALRGQA